jgi:hypothetical protein
MPDPTDLKATAIFEQWASSEYANLDPFTSGLVGEKFFKKWVKPTNCFITTNIKGSVGLRLTSRVSK